MACYENISPILVIDILSFILVIVAILLNNYFLRYNECQ